MTLEFLEASFTSRSVKNSSFDVDYGSGFEDVDIAVNKRKQSVSLSPFEKKSSDSGFCEKRQNNMADRLSDDYDSYEEDFEADENSSPRRDRSSKTGRYSTYSTRSRSPETSQRRRELSSKAKRYSRLSTQGGVRRDSVASYRSTYGNYKGSSRTNVKTRTKKSHTSASRKQSTSRARDPSSLVQRVLSANRHKVSRLHNIVEELEREVSGLKGENKTLKRIQHQQEKEIKKIDVEEASLPQLLQRHSAEVKHLRERLKRSQEAVTRKEREAKDRDNEIFKLKDDLKRYKELCARKNLDDRDSLARKLESIELSLAERDKRILVSERCQQM